MFEDTIAAIATAPGKAGIACVRISGPQAYEVAGRIFYPADSRRSLAAAKGYTALFGHTERAGHWLDETIALCFRAPKSYTGEDVVELSVHGGEAVVRQLLAACYDAGARPAGAGEFTRRAFLNGRLSLTQAEAVMQMIEATGADSARAAAAAMEGALWHSVQQITQNLTALAGHIAAYTDYPEEDVEELQPERLREVLTDARGRLQKLLADYEGGSILRRGIRTAIVGSPNVGKSTLLNLMSGFEKAIVTPIAGTTRDVVEQDVSFEGATLLLADTAGIRQTDDPIEAEGIRRSNQKLEEANLILAVFDSSRPLSQEDLALAVRCRGRLAVAVFNKTDLPRKAALDQIADCFCRVVEMSAREEGFSQPLRQAIGGLIAERRPDPDAALLANERQRSAAARAEQALTEALDAADAGFALDAVSVCVDDALDALFELSGERASDAVIEEVFSKFCVGK